MNRLATPTALLLLLASLASAQDLAGNFSLEGRYTPGGRTTTAELTIRKSGSRFRIERTGRYTSGAGANADFTWKCPGARRVSPRVLRATYQLEPAGGFEATLAGLGADASDAAIARALSARNTLEAMYVFSADGKSVREVVINTTRRGAESRWRQVTTRGSRVEPSTAGPISADELRRRVDEALRAWYATHIEETYEARLADASAEERAAILVQREKDRDFDQNDVIEGDELFEEELHEAYANDDPYRRADGSVVLESDTKVFVLSMFPEYAGIGLSVAFAFDARTGELLAESDIRD